jgi:hypothetical protein
MSAIDTYSSELKPTTEHPSRRRTKIHDMDENSGKHTTRTIVFYACKKRCQHEHYKFFFSKEYCRRLQKGTGTISEAV